MELLDRIRRFRRCGLVGGSVSLGMDFEVSKAYARPSLCLSPDQDVALGYYSSTCLHTTMLPPCQDDNDSPSEAVSPQVNASLYVPCLGHDVSSQQQNSEGDSWSLSCTGSANSSRRLSLPWTGL